MGTFTIKLTKNQILELFKKYEQNLLPISNEYILMNARTKDLEIIAYTTGNVVLKSDNIQEEIKNLKDFLGIRDYDAIGSDEVGTGDLFGPVVVCSALVTIKDIPYLESLNVRDSKKITDEKIFELGPKLAKRLTHSIIMITPKEYNVLVDEGNNLNKIKALLHNQSYIKTITKVKNPTVPIIQDQFCTKEHYYSYLKDEKFIQREVLFYEKAESVHLSVAAAAIIARYAFLLSLRSYSKKVGKPLVKGAGDNATELLLELIKRHGRKVILLLAKKNFKNVEKALDSLKKQA